SAADNSTPASSSRRPTGSSRRTRSAGSSTWAAAAGSSSPGCCACGPRCRRSGGTSPASRSRPRGSALAGAGPGASAAGFDVAGWLPEIPPGPGPTVVSLWYVVHEFTRGRVERAVEFFRSLHAHLPAAEVVLGEIVNLPPEVLADNHPGSIMPEFLLFHAL